MRYIHGLVLISFALLTSSCEKEEKIQVAAPAYLLDKDWHFAMRPDSSGFMAYRVTPIPSRLTDGFLFSSNGTFVRHTFAPNDAPLDIPGTWSTLDGQLFHITPNSNQQAQYDIRIGTLTPTTLRAQVQY
jgi:hypothetical protein